MTLANEDEIARASQLSIVYIAMRRYKENNESIFHPFPSYWKCKIISVFVGDPRVGSLSSHLRLEVL